MKGHLKRIVSSILAFSMVLSLMPNVFAKSEPQSGSSEISFAAARYTVAENEKKIKVKIVRKGGNDSVAEVAVKIADFSAEYGLHYVALDEDGEELPLYEGLTVDESDFAEISADDTIIVADEENTDSTVLQETDTDETVEEIQSVINEDGEAVEIPGVSEAFADESTEATEEENDSEETVTEAGAAPEETIVEEETESEETVVEEETESEEAVVMEANAESTETQKETSRGSSLLDAQAQFLNLPDDDAETSEAVENILTDLNSFFQEAQGALRIVTFDVGETEKEITIKIIDNDEASADKVFMLGLIGLNGDDDTYLAANPTTYVTIMDDEDYEAPVIVPDTSGIVLTAENPVYELLLTRTEGVSYYTSVNVSTVKQTAQEGYHYEKIENASVAFAPGETEKKVKISANNFDEDVSFGIRIESDGTCTVSDEYISVDILKSEIALISESDSSSGGMELMASTVDLGRAKIDWKVDDFDFEYGPSIGGQDGNHSKTWNASKRWTDLNLYEENWKSGRSWVAKKPINLTGVTTLNFWERNIGSHGGSWAAYHDFIELLPQRDRHNWSATGVAPGSWNGKHEYTKRTFNVQQWNDYYYIRFGAKNDGYARDNLKASLGNPITAHYYRFGLNVTNKQVVYRLNYNYDTENGKMTIIPVVDGESAVSYTPKAKLVNRSGNTVSGFYANSTDFIKPVSENPEGDAALGLELEGVYLYTKDSSTLYSKDLNNPPFNDKWNGSNTIWIPASGRTLNAAFMKEVVNKFGYSAIKVMPKFKQNTVTLNIHNTDGGNTYIKNMSSKTAASYKDWGSNGYYNQYKFPVNTTINVSAIAAKGKYITGYSIDHWSRTSENDVNYRDESSPEKLTYTLSENMSFYPKTQDEGFTVAYNPGENKVTENLENVVYLQPATYNEGDAISSTGADGTMVLRNVYAGMPWTLRVTPPEGYYAAWVNGTGDIKNINGRIDYTTDPDTNEGTDEIRKLIHEYSPVYGNVLTGSMIQNNPKYYYYFLPKTQNGETLVQGVVYRKDGTFRDIARGAALKTVAVENTFVNVGDATAYTDSTGHFEVALSDVPSAGYVSLLIDDNGTIYSTKSLINNMAVTLPAYEIFEPKSLKIAYSNSTDDITGTAVDIKDDTLAVTAEVESYGSVIPTDANFFVHKVNGSIIDCKNDTDNRFEIEFENGKAKLIFNPKSVLETGDKIYVEFSDQHGKAYKQLDLGYTFIAPLNLGTFAFPLIGSTLLSDGYSGAFELIGDPLGDVSLGKIGFNEPVTTQVSPPGRDEVYNVSTYQFGDYSKAIKEFASEDGDGENGDEELAEKSDSALEDAPETDDGGYKTKKSFSWSFSPKAVFAMQISARETVDAQGNKVYKYYFEELDFIAGIDIKEDKPMEASMTITLPIGMNVIITGGLSGSVDAIFQLKTDYTGDPTWENNAVEYSAESFGLFEEIDHVNRTGYIMLNPTITLGLGLEWQIIKVSGGASFEFDMDFKFTLNAENTETGAKPDSAMYGDMVYYFDYSIEVLSIKVYSGKTDKSDPVKLFSENADGHIVPDMMVGLMSVEDDTIQSVPVSRSYLNTPTQWNSGSGMSLMTIDTEGTVENEIANNIYPSARTIVAPLTNNRQLMVFVGDVPERSAINRTGLYYSIFNGENWSTPALIDDDGTLDDYPDVFDFGDKLMISWSSANEVLDENATAQEALSALDIKTVFFDKASETFSEVTQLTHDTDEDYTADVEPKAAYDAETDRIILYYTKTEYKDAVTLTDLTAAPSVIAYRICEDGVWSSTYTDEEFENMSYGEEMSDEDKTYYTDNWYGQRFLDARIDMTSGEMLRILETDAISYNGLALYSWIVDYDKDLNTVDDRDVFMQIYNFSENSVSHCIKITPKSGVYSAPKFARCNDETYLFYSAVEKDESNADKIANSGIAYINVSDVIKNEKYSKITEGSVSYYVLKYMREMPASVTNDGMEVPAYEAEITITPGYAVNIDGNINDFDVVVDNDEEMYLTWTDSDSNGSRQIYTSIFNIVPDGEAANDDEKISNESSWSEDFKMTADENVAYGDISTFVINDKLYIMATKTPYIVTDINTSLDSDNTSLVQLIHTPYSKAVSLEKDALIHSTDYVYPNEAFTLTSTVKNEGTNLINEPVTFKFTMTSDGVTSEICTVTKEGTWGAGQTLSVDSDTILLENVSDTLTFNAEITVGNDTDNVIRQELKAEKAYEVLPNGDAAVEAMKDGQKITVPLKNKGNIPSPSATIDVYTMVEDENTLINSFTIDAIDFNSEYEFEEFIDIPDKAYSIDSEGVGVAEITVDVKSVDDTIVTLDTTATKNFDSDAILTLNGITDVTIDGSSTVKADAGDDIEVKTVINGENAENAKIMWFSSDSNVVYVRSDNTLYAAGDGTATVTGYVVPNVETFLFDYSGTAVDNDILESIPDTMYKTVTANVKIGSTSSGSHSGGGGSSTTTKTETNADGSTTTTKTDSKGTVTETTKYTDGSTKVVETKKDGTVTATSTTKEGIVVKTETNAEGELTSFDAAIPETVADEYVELPITVTAESIADAEVLNIKVEGEGTKKVAITVENSDVGIVVYAKNEDGTETIVKDAYVSDGAVVVNIAGDADIKIVDNTKTFTDVLDTDWFADSVKFVSAREIFNGTGEGIFDPNASMTRGMLAKVLHNLENNPAADSKAAFDDAHGHWSADAVAWAAAEGIVSGYDDKTFGVDDEITREQLATMLYRYAGSPEVTGNLDKYTDKEDVSDYATKALIWAVEKGIITGVTETTLEAKGLATRAQVATMIMRFITNL